MDDDLMPIRIRVQIRLSILTPIQIQIQIRIRIGIKTMPIHMSILPQVLHMLENRTNFFYFCLQQFQFCEFTLFVFSH